MERWNGGCALPAAAPGAGPHRHLPDYSDRVGSRCPAASEAAPPRRRGRIPAVPPAHHGRMAAPPLSPLPRLLDISSSSSLGTGMGGGGRLQSWGGRRRSAGATPTYRERRRELARLPASAPIPDVGEGWTTPRDQRSSLQGLRALASASVLREDVYRSMVAVTQGRAPLIDEASLHNLSVSSIQSAVADDRPRRHSRGGTRARGGTPRKHHPTVGSRALRGGQSAVLKSVCTRDQVSSAVDQQRKLGNEIDVLAQDLERTIAELSAVRGRYRCVRVRARARRFWAGSCVAGGRGRGGGGCR
eukprot:COSAG01_NODE_9463_length_2440_cov_1.660402_3_plen_302_part_00